MPLSDANYLSKWDIDQLLYQGVINNITIPANTSTEQVNILFSFNLPFPPDIDGEFQIVGEGIWRQMNDPTSAGGINLNTFLRSTSTDVALVSYNYDPSNAKTINVRYYVWSDKITY